MAKRSSSKGGGILAGIIMVIVGIGLLWWNEGRTVNTQKGINEAKKKFIQVNSNKIESKNENKLIATNGKIDLSNSSKLIDEDFNISASSAIMKRKVEMYQWEEECTTDDNNNEHCTYKKAWNEDLIDSSSFKEGGHTNPSSMPYESKTYLASDVRIGEFLLPEKLVSNLSTKKEKTSTELKEEFSDKIEGYKVEGNMINNMHNDSPQIGNIRISFLYNDSDAASVLAVQSNNSFTEYITKSGTTIFRIKEGLHTGDVIIQDLTNENTTLKWILRLVGTLLVILGIASVFAPLQRLTNFVPILGGAVSLITGLISFVLGLAISLIVIAIAWFRYRPLLSICLLAGVAVLIILLIVLKKKKSNTPSS